MIDLKNIQVEVDASYLYKVLADNEKDSNIADIFRQMSEIEMGHAKAFMQVNKLSESQLPKPSGRARMLNRIGKVMGYDYVLGVLLDTEKSLSSSILKARRQSSQPSSISDTSHVSILKNIMYQNGIESSGQLSRFEKSHKSVGGNALRAAVLGGNDGLVSNFSLVMGIAGATNGKTEVLLAGLAGLLAGSLSMALGEWISVKSSQELYENQMEIEMQELEHNPDAEKQEIELIFRTQGMSVEDAKNRAAELMLDKSKAHQLLVKEELGINADELQGSAMEAAIASFISFAFGAVLPVLPFFFLGGTKAILVSVALSSIGLWLIGAAITLFTGRNVWYSGFRQVFFGLLAALITFGIGKLIGVSIA